MRLENYIMEQDINTASVADIFVEQAQAEMNVMAAIMESYTKDIIVESFIQEGAISDSATVAKGSKYESKFKRVVSFIPRFIVQFFKILIGKIKNIGNPIAALKSKCAKISDKKNYVLPVSKETIVFAQKVLEEVTAVVYDIDKLADDMIDKSGSELYSNESTFMKSLNKINTLIDKLESYDVAASAKKYHDDWVKAVEESHAMQKELAKGKVTLAPGVADATIKQPEKVRMPDIAELTEETKAFVTVAEYEKFAAEYFKAKDEIEPAIKDTLKKVNAIKDKLPKETTTTEKSGVSITTFGSESSNFGKYITEWSKSLTKLSATFSKKMTDIENVFREVLNSTKLYTDRKKASEEAKKKEENSVKYNGNDTFMVANA